MEGYELEVVRYELEVVGYGPKVVGFGLEVEVYEHIQGIFMMIHTSLSMMHR